MKSKQWTAGLLASALTVSLTAPWAVAGGNPASAFSDMDDASWALSAVVTMNVNGVVKGDGDGHFRPGDAVSRQEVVALAIREMGLEQRANAQSIDEQITIGSTIKDFTQVQGWAAADVVLAARLKLLPPSADGALQPEAPASRLWASILLVKALGLDAEAQANMNTTISFADATGIAADARGYVYVAAKHGLVRGILGEDGSLYFRAGNPVTRAQMAVLLARSDDQLAYTPERAAARTQEIRGRIVVADSAAGTVTLLHHGITTTYTMSSDTAVFVDDTLAGLGQVEATMKAKLELNAAGEVVLLNSQTAGDQGQDQATRDLAEDRLEVEGRFVASTGPQVTLSSRGAVRTFGLADNARVESLGHATALNDIDYGASVQARLDASGKIVYLEITNLRRIDDQDKANYGRIRTGLVATVTRGAKGETTLEVIRVARTGARETFALDRNASLEFAGASITAADLKAGDIIAFQADNTVIVKLRLLTHG